MLPAGLRHLPLTIPTAPARSAVRSSAMRDKILSSADEAVALIPDGATVMFGGFISAHVPSNLIRALVRRGTRGLTGIATNIGPSDELDALCIDGQIRRMIASFAIRATTRRPSHFERRWRAGEVELELVPQGTLAERIRAGGAGIRAFFVPTGAGTVAAGGKETRVFDGRTCVLEYGLTADFALIKAHRADTFGNLVYRGAGRNFNAPMATAARTVIAEVEEIVDTGQIDPERVVTPGIYVDHLVQCPAVRLPWRGF
jgi:3-oxoadipate CoA-transferase alpha subunit